MKYVIGWKSKVNGRAGRGTRQFIKEEAERLVSELNTEYPDIHHELVENPEPRTPPEPVSTEIDSSDVPEKVPAKLMHAF